MAQSSDPIIPFDQIRHHLDRHRIEIRTLRDQQKAIEHETALDSAVMLLASIDAQLQVVVRLYRPWHDE